MQREASGGFIQVGRKRILPEESQARGSQCRGIAAFAFSSIGGKVRGTLWVRVIVLYGAQVEVLSFLEGCKGISVV